MRQVGAAARMMFAEAAAARWGVPASAIKIEKSIERTAAPSTRRRWAELAADAMRVPCPRR